MNKHLFRGLAAALASVVVLTTVGAVRLYAEDKITDSIDTDAIKDQLNSIIVSDNSTDKEETVYVLTDAEGNVSKIISSNHLYNSGKEDTLNDVSDLTDIENLKGYEEFTADGTALTWNAAGNSIYYRGTSTKATPVTVKVTYYLDGVEKSASEMAGVSGHVTIRFDYTNNLVVKVSDNEDYYVPFAVISGTFLDTDTFSNITVTNGRVIDDGDRVYCAGIALPGLKEDLGITDDSINIPEYFEISADTTSFELLTTLTMVTNELFNCLDLSGIDASDPAGSIEAISQIKDATAQLADGATAIYNGLVELQDGLNTLKDGSTQLSDGAATLADGTNTLNDGAKQLSSGTKTLSDGASQVSTGADSLAAGATDLSNGADKVSAGASQVSDGAANLATGASQVSTGAAQVATGASQVSDGAASLATGTAQVSAGAQNLSDGLTTLSGNSAALNAGAKQIFESSLDSASKQLSAAGLNVGTLTIDNYSATLTQTIAYLNANNMTTQAAQVQAVKDQLDSLNQFYTGLTQYTAGVDQAASGSETLATGAAQAASGAETLATGASQVSTGASQVATGAAQVSSGADTLATGASQVASGAKDLATGADTLESGAGTLASGAAQVASGAKDVNTGAAKLASGTATLNTGANTLSDGMTSLNDGIDQLIDGANQLTDGSKTLSDALTELDDEANEIIMELSDNLVEVFSKLNKTIEASKQYTSYSGISDDMNGKVKFIYRTESIEVE